MTLLSKKALALEGVLVLALFLAAVLTDIVTAENGTSLGVQLRLTALLYADVRGIWAGREELDGEQTIKLTQRTEDRR